MKFLSLLVLSSLFVSTFSQAASIDLSPGSSIRIRAGEDSVVSCAGSSNGGHTGQINNECRLENIRGYDNIFTVYAGQAKVKTNLSLSQATAVIADLRSKGVCN